MMALLNGTPVADAEHAIALNDRGLAYGDGLFETMRVRDGRVRFLTSHMERLIDGCSRLGIELAGEVLLDDVDAMCRAASEGVLKVIVTRGGGGRGYRPAASMKSNRLLTMHPIPETANQQTARVRWCSQRLSRNTTLAGMKHLNRLEQVLAQREWDGSSAEEGLLLDTEGELISATAANLFIVKQTTVLTSDLRFCGVRGVMRREILRAAAAIELPVSEEPLWPHDLDEANEVFITSAVRGITSIVELEDWRWPSGPVAARLRSVLEL
jgi:4-amino-4-deoxychorismate lyase